MAGTGKFSQVVKATSHMRSSTDGAAGDAVGGQSPEAPKPTLPEAGDKQKRSGPGRPRTGKRSDPGFQQVTALLPSDLYARVKVRIIEEKLCGDFSELVRDLLENWLLAGGRGPYERR